MQKHGLIMPNRTIAWITKYSEVLLSAANCRRFLAFMQISAPMAFDMLMESMKLFLNTQKRILR